MSLDLKQIREDIDSLNQKLADTVKERMDIVVDVAEYKERNGMDIVDEEREEEVKQEFERLFEERGMPSSRGREFADLLIATAIDQEEEQLDRDIDRRS